MTGIELIALERHRQVWQDGLTQDFDDAQTRAELAVAANAYSAVAAIQIRENVGVPPLCFKPDAWPFNEKFEASDDPIVNLVKSGALICGRD